MLNKLLLFLSFFSLYSCSNSKPILDIKNINCKELEHTIKYRNSKDLNDYLSSFKIYTDGLLDNFFDYINLDNKVSECNQKLKNIILTSSQINVFYDNFWDKGLVFNIFEKSNPIFLSQKNKNHLIKTASNKYINGNKYLQAFLLSNNAIEPYLISKDSIFELLIQNKNIEKIFKNRIKYIVRHSYYLEKDSIETIFNFLNKHDQEFIKDHLINLYKDKKVSLKFAISLDPSLLDKKDGFTLYHIAASNGDFDGVKLLKKNNFPQTLNADHNTPFDLAIKNEYYSLAKIIDYKEFQIIAKK